MQISFCKMLYCVVGFTTLCEIDQVTVQIILLNM